MKYYPVFLNIRDKLCVVIGGGKVAERKVSSLLEAGARVQVVSPEVTSTLKVLAQKKKISYYCRLYKPGDLKGSFLAYGTTANMEVNKQMSQEAKREQVILNIVDLPDKCDFIVPSVLRRNDLLIAISTCGKSPAMSKKIREELEDKYGWEYGAFVDLLGVIRARLLTKQLDSSYNKSLFLKLVSSPLPKLIKEGKEMEVDKILKKISNKRLTLSNLEFSIKPNI